MLIMRCIQDTVSRVSVLEMPGAAPDHAFDLLESVLSRRLHIAAGNRYSCCGAKIDLIAVDPAGAHCSANADPWSCGRLE
jgi:hypothetical protein